MTVVLNVDIIAEARDGETDDEVVERVRGLLTSELENLADHDIHCVVNMSSTYN